MRRPMQKLAYSGYLYLAAEDPTEEPTHYTREDLEKYNLQNAKRLLDSAQEQAEGWMKSKGVAYNAAQSKIAPEEHGLELAYPVSFGKLGVLWPDAEFIFDYELEVSGQNFMDALRTLKFIGQGGKNLREAMFNFCNHYFGATDKTLPELLFAVAFLQSGVEFVNPEARLKVVEFEKGKESEHRDWIMDVLIEIREKKIDKRTPKYIRNWLDKTQIMNVISALTQEGWMADDQKKIVNGFLGKLNQPEFEQFMSDLADKAKGGSSGKRPPLTDRIVEVVRDLTQHERYTGSIDVGMGKDGIVARIDAPYAFFYVFDADAPGADVTLKWAGMTICNHTLHVTTEDNAKSMLTANLDLAEAYQLAPQPSKEKETSEEDFWKDLVKEFKRRDKEDADSGVSKEAPSVSEEDVMHGR